MVQYLHFRILKFPLNSGQKQCGWGLNHEEWTYNDENTNIRTRAYVPTCVNHCKNGWVVGESFNGCRPSNIFQLFIFLAISQKGAFQPVWWKNALFIETWLLYFFAKKKTPPAKSTMKPRSGKVAFWSGKVAFWTKKAHLPEKAESNEQSGCRSTLHFIVYNIYYIEYIILIFIFYIV